MKRYAAMAGGAILCAVMWITLVPAVYMIGLACAVVNGDIKEWSKHVWKTIYTN